MEFDRSCRCPNVLGSFQGDNLLYLEYTPYKRIHSPEYGQFWKGGNFVLSILIVSVHSQFYP